MATLQTGTNRLQAIQRQRQMADALAMQAMQYQPIQHPLQGAAKLAQAFVAAKMMKGATKREDELMKQRAEAFASALAPNVLDVRPEGRTLPLEQISGVRPEDYGSIEAAAAGPGQVSEFNRMQQIPVPKTPEQILQALPTDMAEGVMGAIMQQNIMAQMGITPQQLSAQYKDPKDPYAPYTTGHQRMVEIPGQEPFEALVVQRKESGQYGMLDAQNQFTPLDSSWIKDVVDKTMELPGPKSADLAKMDETLITTAVAFDQIDRLFDYIDQPVTALTSESALGGARDMVNRTISTAKQLKNWMFSGVRDNEELMASNASYVSNPGTNRASGRWDSVMADYTKQMEAAQESGQRFRRYSKAELEANRSFLTKFAAMDAGYQQIAISIAYTLARIADPGGRLSEMDVLNQMRALQLDNPDPKARIAALQEAERTFAVTVRQTIRQMRGRLSRIPGADPNQLYVDPEIERRIEQVLSGGRTRQTPGQAIQVPPDVQAFFESVMRTGTPEQKADLERIYGPLYRLWMKQNAQQ